MPTAIQGMLAHHGGYMIDFQFSTLSPSQPTADASVLVPRPCGSAGVCPAVVGPIGITALGRAPAGTPLGKGFAIPLTQTVPIRAETEGAGPFCHSGDRYSVRTGRYWLVR